MSEVASRLRLLQAQSGRAGAVPKPAILDIRVQLRRLLGRRERTMSRPPLQPPGGREIADGLLLVEEIIPAAKTVPLRLPTIAEDPIARERLICFDTETTGLAGGVGTKAFMIGCTRWTSAGLCVRQLYLTALAGEEAMLATFSSWLPEDAVFVSYNGRSYDAPLLKGRYRIHRQQHPFEERGHLDLLHPMRRAYRGVWENCRLKTIEREVLGIHREDDLPGAEAPAAWLAYLRRQTSEPLGRVLAHNRQDVLTLVHLMDHYATELVGEGSRLAAQTRSPEQHLEARPVATI